METIKEFFKHVNYRLSSPFIFSFVIAWLIWNWQIPVTIFFHDRELLKLDGFTSYIDLFNKVITTKSGIIYPIVSAIFYTVFNPFLTSAIHALYTWVQKQSDKWDLQIIGGARISVDKYISLKENVEQREKLLEKIIDDEKGVVKDLEKLRTEKLQLEQELIKLRTSSAKDYEALRESMPKTDYAIIQGKWEIRLPAEQESKEQKFETAIIRGNSYFIEKDGKEILAANLQHYAYDSKLKNVVFIKIYYPEYLEKNPKATQYVLVELKFNEVSGDLTGSENSKGPFYYKSIPLYGFAA